MEHFRTLIQLSKYLWSNSRADLKWRVVFSMCALLVSIGIQTGVPFFLKYAVDVLSSDNTQYWIAGGLVIGYGSARILQKAFGEIRDYIFVNVKQYAQRTIALQTFQHLHELSLAFHLERQTGGLSRVIERGTRGIEFVLSFMLFNIIPQLFQILLVTGVLFFKFNWYFALVTFVTIFGYILFTIFVTEWRLRFRREMNKNDTEANSKAIDSLLNYETVKYFNNEKHEYSRFDFALARYESAAIKSQQSLSLLNVGQEAIIAIGLIAVMISAASGVITKLYTVGDFVLVNTFLIQLYLPLGFLGFVYREVKHSLTDMEKMFELKGIPKTIQDPKENSILTVSNGHVEFRNVEFAYQKERPILKGISFDIPPGHTVAVVGISGAGKSTLSRLLFRFYDVTGGAILIDGQDIRNISQNSLRSAIGVVPQDTVLFNDTIEYNIHYGQPRSSKDDVIRAARLAKIHDFAESLPDGYQTKVGERGLKLSGGEKQRVAIARTILKSPKILVFDEATSALDSKTEKEIQKSLNEVSEGKTTLIIAHRLSTIINSNKIIVLSDGEILESGSHMELLSKNQEYAKMWKRQQESQNESEFIQI